VSRRAGWRSHRTGTARIIASVTVSMTIISRVLIHFRLAEVGVVEVLGPTGWAARR
jgi:hypothetical protein